MSSKRSKGAIKPSTKLKPPATNIPPPFTPAPSTLSALLPQLDPSKIYLTHIDTHPIPHKKNIFLIPVLLNATIAALLLWRLYHALPTYYALTQTLLGYTSAATVNPTLTTTKQQIWILLQRTAMMSFDFFLYRMIFPWPMTFFLESPQNPCSWRWKLGFQREEVVVRVSRNFNTEDLMQGNKKGGESPFFKTKILPAVEEERMRTKTGYLLMDASWDLDFETMLDAHTLISRNELQLQNLDKLVFAHQEGVGWVTWRWEAEDEVVEVKRRRVVDLKDKLTKMGKESLFWRWTEIVEEERGEDGGFTVEQQEKLAKRVKAVFEKNGVDFEEVMGSSGGIDTVPSTTA